MRRKKKVLFITGIDTDAGKSVVTGIIARGLRQGGNNVITQKFIQTGSSGMSEDIVRHREIMGIDLLPEDNDGTTCPINLSYPGSPAMAAEIDNRTIDLNAITESTRKLLEKYDTVLIEGSGGLNVPITQDYSVIDYIKENQLPVVMVTSARLGSINHTILSLEACRARGINVEMLIYNLYPPANEPITNSTRKHFQYYLSKYHPCTIFAELDTNMNITFPENENENENFPHIQ